MVCMYLSISFRSVGIGHGINLIALRTAKPLCSVCHSECSRVKGLPILLKQLPI